MPTAQSSLVNIDRRCLIHPVSAFRAHETNGVRVLTSGRGMYVTDDHGRELLDAFAGLWCVNVGYGQESVIQAAMKQMRQLPYASGYFDFGSEPAIQLAGRLVEVSPKSLTHVYFTLGGSDAVDSAIRYIVHYFNATGRPSKKHFIVLDRGYHGSTTAGAGLTGIPTFHRNFDVPYSWQHHISSPNPYRSPVGNDPQALIADSVAALRAKVNELGRDNVAAFFCEPVLGAGGVIVPPRGWLRAMREACADLDILFVADEVITGFGRTGTMFACDRENVEPDLMTLAKGLTSGYAPMGAVLMSDKIYEGIADGAAPDLVIGHGFTYSGHPVSAAIGLEVLRLYTEGGLIANALSLSPHFDAHLRALREHPLIGDARALGLLGALELVSDKRSCHPFDRSLHLSQRLFNSGYANGLIFRAFDDGIIGFAPALCCTRTEMDIIFERVRKTLDDVLDDIDIRAALR